MPLNDIVNVVITRQTQTVSETGFGIPMILGTSVRFNELIKYYSNIDEVALDFQASDPEYIAAQDIFSQNISPSLIAIGRRQVDNVVLDIVSASPEADYVLNINGDIVTTNSTSTTTYSIVNLSADLVPNNRINVTIENPTSTPIYLTYDIDFDIDFVASNSILTTINGATALGPVIFNTDQATTIQLVANSIAVDATVLSATVTGLQQIRVVFNTPFVSPSTSIVNSVITTLGATQPVATITQYGFVYDTSMMTTMNNIAIAIGQMSNIDQSFVSGLNFRTLTVVGPTNTTAKVTSFVVTLGAQQAVATITNPLQPVSRQSIAQQMVIDVNLAGTQVLATDNLNGTINLLNQLPGVPWTLKTSTNITNPNRALVVVTQIQPGRDYTIAINNLDFTYRTPANIQTADQIATALTDIINADQTLPISATNLGNGIIELLANGINTFSLNVTNEILDAQIGIKTLPLVAANAVSADLTAINNANSDWYALISTSRNFATVLEIAGWVESRIKLFGTTSNDLDIINVPAGTDTTSIAAVLGQMGYVRSFVMYHQDALNDYPEAAWFGAVLPLEPGSETWKFKTLNSISYSNLTTTQSLNAFGKKANTYEFVAGVGITQNGTVAQGEYIDIVRGIDWLTARIQEFVFRVLVTNSKVPYTDAGIATIQAEVLRVLQLGIDNDFISESPAPTCTVPRAADVPPADKAARILRNVRFQATLSGAIHAVLIRGTVSV